MNRHIVMYFLNPRNVNELPQTNCCFNFVVTIRALKKMRVVKYFAFFTTVIPSLLLVNDICSRKICTYDLRYRVNVSRRM